MLHIAVTNLVKRQEIVDRAKQILQADASEVPDADAARAMISEDWRGPREVVELTSYEFHTHALRVLKNFAQREKLTDDVTARLARIVEDQWDASANASGSLAMSTSRPSSSGSPSAPSGVVTTGIPARNPSRSFMRTPEPPMIG